MDKNLRLLMVDDDSRLCALMRSFFEGHGFEFREASNSETADKILLREYINLIILDWMLPAESGLDYCTRLRDNNHQVPIIMLTAKSDDTDRILGLNAGADDYLPKPYNPDELLARIRAILRRPQLAGAHSVHNKPLTVRFGEFVFYVHQRRLIKNGKDLTLTTSEYAVLKVLVLFPGEPVSRDRLMEMAKGREYSAVERGIDIQISRLRKLIEVDPKNPRYILSVWGIGYMFVPDPETEEQVVSADTHRS